MTETCIENKHESLVDILSHSGSLVIYCPGLQSSQAGRLPETCEDAFIDHDNKKRANTVKPGSQQFGKDVCVVCGDRFDSGLGFIRQVGLIVQTSARLKFSHDH